MVERFQYAAGKAVAPQGVQARCVVVMDAGCMIASLFPPSFCEVELGRSLLMLISCPQVESGGLGLTASSLMNYDRVAPTTRHVCK